MIASAAVVPPSPEPPIHPDEARALNAFLLAQWSLPQAAESLAIPLDALINLLSRPAVAARLESAERLAAQSARITALKAVAEALENLAPIARRHESHPVEARRACSTILATTRWLIAAQPHPRAQSARQPADRLPSGLATLESIARRLASAPSAPASPPAASRPNRPKDDSTHRPAHNPHPHAHAQSSHNNSSSASAESPTASHSSVAGDVHPSTNDSTGAPPDSPLNRQQRRALARANRSGRAPP